MSPFGIIGLETALGLALEHVVHPGKIPLARLVALLTTGPASVLHLDRGTLRVGAPAEVTIFSTDLARVDLRRQTDVLEERNSRLTGIRSAGGRSRGLWAGP
jgi:dihydroorotase